MSCPRADAYVPFLATRGATWDKLKGRGKHVRFWAFFETRPAVHSVYGCDDADSVGALLSSHTHSIEHVVPRSTMKRLLAGRSVGEREGAALNPYNWLAAARDANSMRGTREYDTDGDVVKRAVKGETCVGVDRDGEWVVPLEARGDVARAVLYMVAAYRLAGYVPATHVDVLLAWHRADPPSAWERAYAKWVRVHPLYHGLVQPLVERPNEGLDALRATLLCLAVKKAPGAPRPWLLRWPAPAAACRACALRAKLA